MRPRSTCGLPRGPERRTVPVQTLHEPAAARAVRPRLEHPGSFANWSRYPQPNGTRHRCSSAIRSPANQVSIIVKGSKCFPGQQRDMAANAASRPAARSATTAPNLPRPAVAAQSRRSRLPGEGEFSHNEFVHPAGNGVQGGDLGVRFARDPGGDSWRLGRGDERLGRPGSGSLPQTHDFGPVFRKVQLSERVQGCRSQ